MIPGPLAHFVIVLVCIVWAANFAAPFFLPAYVSDPQLNLVFMSIVGGALALSRRKDRSDDP